MPCTYYGPGEEAAMRADEYHKRVELLTQLLCSACQGLENIGSNMLRPNGPLGDWWIAHKNLDKKRLEAEVKAKQDAVKSKENKIAQLEKELKKLKKGMK